MLVMPVYALYCTENGLAEYDLFLLQAIYSFSVAVLEIPSGYLADFIGRKKTLFVGSVLGTLGFLIYSLTGGFWYFLLAELVLGMGQSFISGSDSAMLYDTLASIEKKDKYLKYEGRITSFGSFAETLAALAGGAIAFSLSARWVFIAQTIVAFIAVPAAFFLVEPERCDKCFTPSWHHIFSVAKESVWTNKKLSSTIFMSSIIGTATLTMAWMTLIYLTNYHHLSEEKITPAWVVLNGTVALVSFFAESVKQKIGYIATLILIAVCIPSGYFLLGLSGLWTGLAVLLGFYIVRGVATPVLKDLINMNCRSEVRATVLSVRSLIIRLLFAGISPLLVITFDDFGMQTGLIFFSVFLFVFALPALLFIIKQGAYKHRNYI